MEPFDTLVEQKEIITKAWPSFVIVAGVMAAILFGIFQWTYGAQIEHWKGLAEQNALASVPFTAVGAGCMPTNFTGAGSAGTFTLAGGRCTAVTILMDSALKAPNGWHCSAGDKTALAHNIWVPQWYEVASTPRTATIPIPLAADAMDVITFGCKAY